MKVTQGLIAEQQERQSQPLPVGNLDAPRITPLGSLDDDRGTNGLGIEVEPPKPVLAIIYNGI
jgi:hypothetical protein